MAKHFAGGTKTIEHQYSSTEIIFSQPTRRFVSMSTTDKNPGNEEATLAQAAAETPSAAQPRQLQIDDSKVLALYANFCRVTGTPEELIIDFGLNPQPFGIPTQPIPVTQRIITNFYTAKRMLAALQMTIQRHEGVFGVLETDVQKRVKTSH
jgi:hypothetical protein